MKMKLSRLVYLLVAVLAFGLFLTVVHAQKKGSKGKTITITGCLQKGDEASEFAISGQDGKNYELVSKTVALKDHLGHKVTVTGTLRREKQDADEDEKEAGEGWSGQVQVTSLKMISTSCQ